MAFPENVLLPKKRRSASFPLTAFEREHFSCACVSHLNRFAQEVIQHDRYLAIAKPTRMERHFDIMDAMPRGTTAGNQTSATAFPTDRCQRSNQDDDRHCRLARNLTTVVSARFVVARAA
jgi:hypothetical protein